MNNISLGIAQRFLAVIAALTLSDLGAQTLVVTGDDGQSLYEVDVITGAAQLIGAGQTNNQAWGGTLDQSGNFFLPLSNGKDLGTLDRTTGVENLIALSNFATDDFFAMEIDTRTGILFAGDYANSDRFYRVNKTTGVATLIGNTGVNLANGKTSNDFAFAPDGTLWAAVGDSGSNDLYKINPNSGASTFVVAVQGVNTLATIAFTGIP